METTAPIADKGGSCDRLPNPPIASINNTPAQTTHVSELTQPDFPSISSQSSHRVASINTFPPTPEVRAFQQEFIEGTQGGYDSDGAPPPWQDNEQQDTTTMIVGEEPLPDQMPIVNEQGPVDANPNPTTTTVRSTRISISDVDKMNVKQLREELGKRRQSKNGIKAVLQKRLKDAIQNNIVVIEDMNEDRGNNGCHDRFTVGANDGFNVSA